MTSTGRSFVVGKTGPNNVIEGLNSGVGLTKIILYSVKYNK